MGDGDGGNGILHVMASAHGQYDFVDAPVGALYAKEIVALIDPDLGGVSKSGRGGSVVLEVVFETIGQMAGALFRFPLRAGGTFLY